MTSHSSPDIPDSSVDGSTAEAVESFLSFLTMIAEQREGSAREQHPDWVWHSAERLLLTMAGDPVVVEDLTLPDGIERGPVKACFYTAYMISQLHPHLDYAEGFAQSPGLFPMNHAWLVDRETGRIIDPTWVHFDRTGPTVYLGLRFADAFMNRLVSTETADGDNVTSVFEADWQRRHRALRRGLLRNAEGLVYDFGDPPPF